MGGLLSLGSGIDLNITEADLGYKPEVSNTIECLVELIRLNAGHVVVITGAGISSHQLPTFRSDNNSGLWEAFSPPILAKDNFYQDPKPCWKLLANLRNLQVSNFLHPSLAHFCIHYLMQRGFVSDMITQNIDGLHMFKSDKKHVVELHGAVSDYGECETCSAVRHVDNLKVLQSGECPRCEVCGRVLKPPVAFFGDMIDPKKREQANEALSQANVVILVGTHCTVDPVLSMGSEAKRNGALLIEINIVPTSASRFVDVSLVGPADKIFQDVCEQLIPDIDYNHINIEQWE